MPYTEYIGSQACNLAVTRLSHKSMPLPPLPGSLPPFSPLPTSFPKPLDYNVTSYSILRVRKEEHLDSHFYHTGQFAQKADVSVRTLRYYDKVGLLSPSYYTEAGYRLYTDTDFSRLQQILALKFLGFSLREINQCLRIE